MNSNLQLVKSAQFNGVTFNCYKEAGQLDDSDFWATREQIGQLLEYVQPEVAITKIHQRNQERLDKFSTVTKLVRVEGDREVEREITVYDFKGLLEICRYSNQPKADAVMDFLWNIADEIRRTGSYGTKNNLEFNFEIEREKIKNERIGFLQHMLDNPHNYPLTDVSKTIIAHEVYKLITGSECLAMLPQATEARYSATEIGKMFGVSSKKIGRIANDNGLKSKQGESNEFGTWICTKSQHSNHECLSFVYNDKAVDWFRQHFSR